MSELSRRNLLKLGLGAAAVSAIGNVRAENKKIPIGLQLYSIREVIQKDIPGHFKQLKEMGYEGVEFAGFYGFDNKAAELRKMLDDAGLKCCGSHSGYNTFKGAALPKAIEFHKTIGNNYINVPGISFPNAEGWENFAKEMTEIAEKLKPEGMHCGYHAHGGDFKKMGDSTPWDIFFTKAGQDVCMQLDTGNSAGAGVDPIAYLKKYPGRTLTIHIKGNGGIVGEDKLDWKTIIDLCRTISKTEWFIVEEEGGKEKSMDTVKRALDNFKKLLSA
ncbi:MAG TPA: sugar phosphate isomerase/epimerase [Planctomycetota bacterium]|jgi:sugar phosphate isomerase/epimerase